LKIEKLSYLCIPQKKEAGLFIEEGVDRGSRGFSLIREREKEKINN